MVSYMQRQLDLSGWVTKMNFAFVGHPRGHFIKVPVDQS